ncbi:transglycosylase domain-containing protein [Terrihabitans sp. B22-R8]|uniref:transglycosylase domain-containing protein n=1 Tax=Terrihabitans sp. B22-R8 TaxID=3425128 RepID=UPI00403D496D
MRNLLSGPTIDRIKRALLALDSAIDAAAYRALRGFGAVWERFVGASQDMRMRGWKRGVFEVVGEGATWGTLGALMMLALAQPAFQATKEDWRKRVDLAVVFQDRTGAEIGRRGVMQTDVGSLDDIADSMIKSAMAIEDRRFFQHFGIDVPGTLRAIVENARHSGVVQGGSSLSQQLAKNLFLSNERTLERKVKEAFLAIWLEVNLSKEEILKLYLDRAYMGGGAFGVEAAAQLYFGKSARTLSLAESAMLAGLFKAPTKFAPHANLSAARARANVVLDTLVASGFMTEGQVHAARLNPATPIARQRGTSPDYYLDWAFLEVKKLADAGKLGGSRSVVVKTSLDPAVQSRAEESIENLLRQYGTQYGVKQAGLVLMEPFGAVRAIVGGRDYGASQFNRGTDALRQPGSSFKPYVYTAAMMNGYTANSIVTDGPITIGNWSPQNYGRSFAGRVTLMSALARSLNTVPIRLGLAVGLNKVVETAKLMGVRTPLRINRALALGTSEVTVLDQAAGYSSLANGGFRVEPYAAVEISDNRGALLWRHDRDAPAPERTIPAEAAAEMNRLMVNVVDAGTGRRAALEGLKIGGKTGTSQDYRDAWFIGYSGDFTCAVWFGNDNYSGTREMTGGTLPAMAFKEVMTVAQAGVDPRPIPGISPSGAPSAAIASAASPESHDNNQNGRLPRRASIVLDQINDLMQKAEIASISNVDTNAGTERMTAETHAVDAKSAPTGQARPAVN